MNPLTQALVIIITGIIGKLIDGYFAKSEKYPRYIGIGAYLKNKLKNGRTK